MIRRRIRRSHHMDPRWYSWIWSDRQLRILAKFRCGGDDDGGGGSGVVGFDGGGCGGGGGGSGGGGDDGNIGGDFNSNGGASGGCDWFKRYSVILTALDTSGCNAHVTTGCCLRGSPLRSSTGGTLSGVFLGSGGGAFRGVGSSDRGFASCTVGVRVVVRN